MKDVALHKKALVRFSGLPDLSRKIFCKLEEIQQGRGSIGIAFWINVWTINRKRAQGVVSQPSLYLSLDKDWVTA